MNKSNAWKLMNILNIIVLISLIITPLAYSQDLEAGTVVIKQKENTVELGQFGKMSQIIVSYITIDSEKMPLMLTISHDQSENVTVTRNSATIYWQTDQATNGLVHYGVNPSNLANTRSQSVNGTTNHTITLEPLAEQTNYYYKLNSTDSTGTSVYATGNFTTKDSTAPAAVNNLVLTSLTYNKVSISWDRSTENDFDHYMILRSNVNIANTTNTYYEDNTVRPRSQYTYRIRAIDTSGNLGLASTPVYATTEDAPFDVIAPDMSQIRSNATDRTALITWNTDENSTSTVYYGLTEDSLINSKTSEAFGESTRLLLINLQNGTKYYFKAQSCDVRNNCANSSIQDFTTEPRDIYPPFIEASVPLISITNPIILTINTEPQSRISVDVNSGQQDYQAIADDDGFVNLSAQLSDGDNNITIRAIDPSGNEATLLLQTLLDLMDPQIFVNQIPSFVGEPILEIEGVVNKDVLVQIIVIEGGIDRDAPEKIIGLRNVSVGPNYIDLAWNSSSSLDFDEYIIFMNDIPIKGVQRPNTRISALDSNKSYSFSIAAVDQSCNIGPRSDSINLNTASGNVNLNIIPSTYNHTCSERTRISAEDNYSRGAFKLNVSLRDGNNTIIVKAIDSANRTANATFDVFIDTEFPTVRDLNPRSGTNIYEVNANSVTISGITEPFSKVKLFSVRSTIVSSNLNSSEVEELILTEIDEEKKANKDGKFEFEDVNLLRYAGGGVNEVSAGYEDTAGKYDDIRKTDEAVLMLKVTDLAGKESNLTINYKIGICFSGELVYNIIPLPQFQSPFVLSPERLAEGTEELAFAFNVTKVYGDPDVTEDTTRRVLPNVKMNVIAACDRYIAEKEHYNWSCKALTSCRAESNPQGTMFYVKCRLNRLSSLENFTADDWKDFFKALQNEMRFPLKVTLAYTTKDTDGNSISGTQSSCEEVSYILDNARIDPRDVLPDWLLNEGVDFLNKSIENIQKVNDKISEVLRIAAMGCIGSVFGKAAVSTGRIFTCKSEQIKQAATAVTGVESERIVACQQCMNTYIGS